MPTVPKLPTTLPPLNEDAVESEDTVSLWMVDCDLETMDDIGGELLSPPLEEVEEKPRTLAKGDIVTYSCPSELCSKVRLVFFYAARNLNLTLFLCRYIPAGVG